MLFSCPYAYSDQKIELINPNRLTGRRNWPLTETRLLILLTRYINYTTAADRMPNKTQFSELASGLTKSLDRVAELKSQRPIRILS